MENHNENSTLIDSLGRPLRVLRLSVTDRCNFNCTYCMPEKNIQFLPKKEILSFEEIITVVSLLQEFGVRKIKITGGEPTLRMGLDILIRKLTALEGIEDIGLITNGFYLKGLAGRLYDAGLRRLNVSLDAIDPVIFQSLVGDTHPVDSVLEGIDHARMLGFSPIKMNCVIQKGINDNQVLTLAAYCKERNIDLRFIEFMDVGSIDWVKSKVVPSHVLLEMIQKRYRLVPIAASSKGEVAKRYKHSDGESEIGFISSVTQPFCQDCDRLRLSADGTLYGCLFSTAGKNLKPYLHCQEGYEELRRQLKDFWLQRNDRYSERRAENPLSTGKVPMNFIGG